MTDNEIIKALECCTSHKGYNACISGCPFHEQGLCLVDADALPTHSLDLINRQKAEIEKHKKRCSCCGEKTTKTIINLQELLAKQRAAIERLEKELAER